MAKTWKASPAADAHRSPTTITECARRYHACAVALAQSLGLSLAEVLWEHRESVTAVFIEAGRAGVRLPASAKLPPLAAQGNGYQTLEAAPEAGLTASGNVPEKVKGRPSEPDSEARVAGEAPMTIPAEAGLPCGGQGIDRLTPVQLRMLLGKVAGLAREHGGRWPALLEALQAERARRLAWGRRPAGAAADEPGSPETRRGS